MKKFKFTLAKLLEIKEQQLKQEKENLSVLRKKQITLEQEKADILIKYQEYNKKFNHEMITGLSVTDIQSSKTYLMHLRDEAHLLDEKIQEASKDIEVQVQVVMNATMDVKVVEKLKAKKVEQYNKELSRDEEIFIEEYINTSKHMSEGSD